MTGHRKKGSVFTPVALTLGIFYAAAIVLAQPPSPPVDRGPRSGAAGAGGPIAGLSVKEAKFFDAGLDEFNEIASPAGGGEDTEEGLGPRFNLTGCATCHAHPAVGGTSPAQNPQVNATNPVAADPTLFAAQVQPLLLMNIIRADGPVREVRFASDGGVHDLFTITGLPGSNGCVINQPDFAGNLADLRFRIPTPTFGLGLIEAIEDKTIIDGTNNTAFGISGRVNRNGNDGTVTRFGWKAQNKSLVIFSGEAYNVEQGITNELFPDERGEGGMPDPDNCRHTVEAPQDLVHYELTQPQKLIDNVNAFANFMRFLAPPTPVASFPGATAASVQAGSGLFDTVGCNACHVRSMMTGPHITAALSNKQVNLFSDLLLHDLGISNGDGIGQGVATGDEFRTAPLWGLGQRLFFMHDGRANDLLSAIAAHGGEAATVVGNYNALSNQQKQDLINFLRSL